MEGPDGNAVRAAIFVLAGLAAGSGGSAVYDVVRDPRPNPYTSIDAARDKRETYKRIDKLTAKLELMLEKLHKMELERRDMLNDIERLRNLLELRQHQNRRRHRERDSRIDPGDKTST